MKCGEIFSFAKAFKLLSAAIITGEGKPFLIRGSEMSRDGPAPITTARLLLHKFFHSSGMRFDKYPSRFSKI